MVSMADESSLFSYLNQVIEYYLLKRRIEELEKSYTDSIISEIYKLNALELKCELLGVIEQKCIPSRMVMEEFILPSTDILVGGRSGVGKSTLINTLVGGTRAMDYAELETPSLIKWFQGKDCDIRCGEIPDLSISATRAKAAEELRKCLTEGGNYKLVFVCELESGRVHADDVTTIKVVLDAINDDTFPYSIVFNKMTRQMSPEIEKWLVASLTSGHKPPSEVFCFPYDVQLENGDTAILAPNKNFQNFIERQQRGVIQPDKLNRFNLRAFDSYEHFQSDGSDDHSANLRNVTDSLSEPFLYFSALRPNSLLCPGFCNVVAHCKHSDSPAVSDIIDGNLNSETNITPTLDFGRQIYTPFLQCAAFSRPTGPRPLSLLEACMPNRQKIVELLLNSRSFCGERMLNLGTHGSGEVNHVHHINDAWNNFTPARSNIIQMTEMSSEMYKRWIKVLLDRTTSVRLLNNDGSVMGKHEFIGYYYHWHDGVHIWVNIPRPYIQENIDANQGQVNISIDLASILQDFETA